jgi:hypothetical protein
MPARATSHVVEIRRDGRRPDQDRRSAWFEDIEGPFKGITDDDPYRWSRGAVFAYGKGLPAS